MKKVWVIVLMVVSLVLGTAMAEEFVPCEKCGWSHAADGICYNFGGEQKSETVEKVPQKTQEVKNKNLGEELWEKSQSCVHEWEVISALLRVEGNKKIFMNQWVCGKCNLRGEAWESEEEVIEFNDEPMVEQETETNSAVVFQPNEQVQKMDSIDFTKVLVGLVILIFAIFVICKMRKAYKRFCKEEKEKEAKNKKRKTVEAKTEEPTESTEESAVLEPDEISEPNPKKPYGDGWVQDENGHWVPTRRARREMKKNET